MPVPCQILAHGINHNLPFFSSLEMIKCEPRMKIKINGGSIQPGPGAFAQQWGQPLLHLTMFGRRLRKLAWTWKPQPAIGTRCPNPQGLGVITCHPSEPVLHCILITLSLKSQLCPVPSFPAAPALVQAFTFSHPITVGELTPCFTPYSGIFFTAP